MNGRRFTHLISKNVSFCTQIQAHFSYFVKTWPDFGELHRKGNLRVNSWKFYPSPKISYKNAIFGILCLGGGPKFVIQTHSQMFQKVEYGWGPVFKVILECLKRCSDSFLIYIYGIQCDFMAKSCWKHSNFKNSLNSLCKSGSWPQKSPKKKPKKPITQSRFTQIFE